MFMTKELPRCPVEVTMSLINDRWKVLILRELINGTKRFGEIRKALGNVSTKVLTAALRSMEEDGLLTRQVYPEVPPKVEYTLTDTGYSLQTVLFAMVEWGAEYKSKVEGQLPIRTKEGHKLIIMRAEQQDLQEILNLQHLAYQSEVMLQKKTSIPPLTQILPEMQQEFEKGIFLKAVDDNNTIVGAVRAYSENDILYIRKLIVHPDLQGQGVGTKLLEEIERICPHLRCETFTSSKSERNIRLFERLGYSILKEQEISDGLKLCKQHVGC